MSSQLAGQRSGVVLLGLALAAGLVASAWIVAGALERIKRAGDKIAVKGYAEERIVSDVGVWRGNLTTRAPDLQAAYRKLEEDARKVRAFLQSATGTDTAITAGAVSMGTQYELNAQGVMTGRIAGYQLDQLFEVTADDVELIGRVAREASQLISQGVELNSWPPQFFYRDLNEVKVRLIGAATRDARERAEQFAGNSGVQVGALKSASQGVFQITQLNSTETADYGSYDTSTIEKVVKAVVTIEYAVERD